MICEFFIDFHMCSQRGVVAWKGSSSKELVRLVLATLPVPATTPDIPDDATPLKVGPRPAAVLTKRPSWQGPVAQSLCRASGLPALLDVCGRAMK